MSDGFNPSKWSARNPLGIIALFISLIYGMSALLLGTSVGSLTPCNQTILVSFIVVFPFVVLGVFGWLVAQHHRKLYGPSDYRSDESFLGAANSLPAVLGQRLTAEAEEVGAPSIELGEAGNNQAVPPQAPSTIPGTIAQRIFVAQNLVFQDLQIELQGTIRREVVLASKGEHMRVDGIIETRDTTYVVEVKLIRSVSKGSMYVRRALEQLKLIQSVAKRAIDRPIQLVLAVVFDVPDLDEVGASILVDEARVRIQGISPRIEIYSLDALLVKYNLTKLFEKGPEAT